MLLGIGAIGFVLSLGMQTPVYGWVYHVFPPMQGLRAAARFGNLFLLGHGRARRPSASRRCAAACPPPALASSSWRSSPSRISSRSARHFSTRVSRAFRRSTPLLANEPGPGCPGGGPVLSAAGRVRERRIRAQLHRALAAADERLQRLRPAARIARTRRCSGSFPQEHAIQAMRRAGVTHVMVHPGGFWHRGRSGKDVAGRRGEPVSRTDRDDAGGTGALPAEVRLGDSSPVTVTRWTVPVELISSSAVCPSPRSRRATPAATRRLPPTRRAVTAAGCPARCGRLCAICTGRL